MIDYRANSFFSERYPDRMSGRNQEPYVAETKGWAIVLSFGH